jgi:hypothetical protein
MKRFGIFIAFVFVSLAGCATCNKLMDNREYGNCLEKCDEMLGSVDDPAAKQVCRNRCEKDREQRASLREFYER